MQQLQPPRGRVRLTEVNPHLVCVLCHGYFVDATTMAECPHSFCRSCIVLYLETKSYCPICEVQIHKTKPHLNLKPDKTLQDIVYKLVPGLFHDEMRRRREFYVKYPNRDLYLGPEARGVGVERIIYSPEDHISLSLEYYDERCEVDADTQNLPPNESDSNSSDREREEWASARLGTAPETITQQQPAGAADGMKRYLQCPAVLTMSHLKKFIRLKYGLSQACTVEILYRRESLPDSYSLMDIAYIYTWKRNGPMRFYYRIHVPTPLKTVLPALKPSSEPIRDSVPLSEQKLKSPELLDAVGLRPKPPEPLPLPKPVFDFQEDEKKEEKAPVVVEAKKEDEKKISPEEDTAVSQLLALSNGQGPQKQQSTVSEQQIVETKQTNSSLERPPVPPVSADGNRQPTGNGNVFKVPQSLTKRFVFNGGKLVAVKSKQPSGKPSKTGDKTKVNGKLNGEVASLVGDRYSNPLGLVAAGPLGNQGGRLPPGSPRPPPNSDKFMKTKYMPPSGLLLNRLTPEITLSQNKVTESSPKPPQQPSSQTKGNPAGQKTNGLKTSGQPPHRKEVNRLEQIVQNCLKKEISQKSLGGGQRDADGVKRSGTLPASAGNSEAARAAASIPQNHVAVGHGKPDHVNITENKETERSILKRKLNDPPYNKRPAAFSPPAQEGQNGVGDPKKRRTVHPDVSIELMANPAKEKQQKERKREPSDLSTLTKRFLHDIQKMKMIDSEIKINKVDQMCASTVKIEKVPAPPSQVTTTPKPGPGGEKKSIEGTEFNSEDDQLFIDIRNKCEALKRKNPEPVTIAIERMSEDQSAKPGSSPTKGTEAPAAALASGPDTPPKSSGTHKKLPRLIEINAPPRPKLPTTPGADSKQKTGIKMTTVRKEVPIGKEGPLVRRDCNGALDLSSGLSPPGTPKNRSKSPFQRPASTERSPTPSALSPLLAMSSFSHPESNRSPPIRIPSLKPKTSPSPRPSSLSSSSPSPPAEPRPAAEVLPSAYQQLLRHQMELQSRFLASQVNNNNWTREQPLTAKKFEEWMRNVMNLPHHPLMFPNQLSPDAAGRK